MTILQQLPCLLIWDNFEPVAGFPSGSPSDWKANEQRELRDFLRDLSGGQTKVLLTSRRDEKWLGKIYRLVELRGLRLNEAQELAVRVLKRAGMEPNDIRVLPQYNDLLLYLRSNPLAIQVILPELQRKTPQQLLEALKKGETTFGADDPQQGRERSLSASLSYRLETLDPTLHNRLGVLGLFQGFVNVGALADMCKVEEAPELIRGLNNEDWIRMLDTAAEVGLLRNVAPGMYTVHPALPWFFHDRMLAAFPQQIEWLETAFSSVYGQIGSALFQLFNTNAQTAMYLLQAEENNLRFALQLARRKERWDDIKNILYGINQLFIMQGRWLEWERLIGEIQTEVTDRQGEPLLGRESLWIALLSHQAEMAFRKHDLEEASQIYFRLKNHYEGVHDDKNVAVTLHQLGRIAQERRRFDEAESWFRQSLEIKEHIGNEQGQSSTLHQLGNIAFLQRRFDEAESWYRQSLAIEERIGNEQGQSSTLHQLGMIAQERRRFDEAESWYRQSLEIRERIGDEQGQAQSLHQLGIIAQMRRRFDEAESWYRQSLEIWKRIGDEQDQAMTFGQLGMLAEEQGRNEEAIRFYRQAEAIFSRIDDPYHLDMVRKKLQRVLGEGKGMGSV